jgi:hypothetical protein
MDTHHPTARSSAEPAAQATVPACTTPPAGDLAFRLLYSGALSI